MRNPFLKIFLFPFMFKYVSSNKLPFFINTLFLWNSSDLNQDRTAPLTNQVKQAMIKHINLDIRAYHTLRNGNNRQMVNIISLRGTI